MPVLVRNRAGLSRLVHRHHPFDVVGWDGCVYPYALNIADFEPIVGRLHQPPPVHQTFELPGAVICSFVPRLFDFHPDAVKVPYHHANTDSDEVLFYSAGNFMSRAGSGIGVGSISYHPAGFVHGPQPGSVEASLDQTATEEVAVMLDTFAPLRVTDAARAVSDDRYPFTWVVDTWSVDILDVVGFEEGGDRAVGGAGEESADHVEDVCEAVAGEQHRLVVVDVVGRRAHRDEIERTDLGVVPEPRELAGELSSPVP